VALIKSIPVALLVIAVIVPVPLRSRVPELVRVVVVIAPEPVIVVVPELLRMAVEQVPLIFKVAEFVNPPVPASAVPTVSEPLLVTVITLIVTLGIVKVPVRVCAFVLNVWTPVLAVKVPLFVIPPWKIGVAAAVSFHVEPELIVTAPVTVNAIAAEMVNVAFVAVPRVIDAKGFAGATLRVGCEPEKAATPI
jgi:hypothetical protein